MTINELLEGSRILKLTKDGSTTSINYIIEDCSSRDEAYSLLSVTAPDVLTIAASGPMYVESISITYHGNDQYTASVDYSSSKPETNPTGGNSPEQPETPTEGTGETAPGQDPQNVLSNSWSFSTGNATQHITHSITTVARYAPDGETATDHGGAINVTTEGIGGVDIHAPEPRLRFRQEVPNLKIGRMVQLTWAACRMNQNAFLGFWPRELLFMGAEAPEANGENKREITFEFAYSPTYAGFTVGDVLVVLKQGWDYMWVEYSDGEDETGTYNFGVIAVHIEQVYDEIDFETVLGLTNVTIP